ncbi:Hypothetical predicted protein [Mytilus galloprovincialis]|uniref:DZIP3-like HEPN domain-containing protein n=1 Tax=Mytilus galloprovincialis TaxID=29158 RepID=A0A8B6EHF4_MYTGA|nr:Hypothetical predicted protein [Mytilus galloprovincialis]
MKKLFPCDPKKGSCEKSSFINTDTAIGDDIERIRLTRNELQHSATYELADTRFIELCNIIQDLLERFDQRNKPTVEYSERLADVLANAISEEDIKHVRQQLECKINSETELQIQVLHETHDTQAKSRKH